MHSVNKIVAVNGFKLKLLFDNKEGKCVNLKQKLESKSTEHNSLFKQLLNKNYFKQVKLQPEWETIYWDNGIDFCPDTLYKLAKND